MTLTTKKIALTSLVTIGFGLSFLTVAQSPDYKLVVKPKNIITTTSNSTKALNSKYQSITVENNGRSIAEVIEELKRSGKYASVEVDIDITTPTPAPIVAQDLYNMTSQTLIEKPNDPDYYMQSTLFDDNFGNSSSANILNAWTILGDDLDKKVDVVVLDSGFFAVDDVVYVTGANFGHDRNGGSNFLEDPEGGYCSSHGTGVASVIGATVNNSLSIAGVAPSIDIHAARVMDCGAGRMSDAARAIEAYASGNMPYGAAEYSGKAGVMNLSLGGSASSCPSFVQEPINLAVEKGWKVVVAAGNSTIDVNNWVPANCDNVIVVGATHFDGKQSDFSNFGEKVDISALGYDVAGLCKSEGLTCYWEGTSFAAPIVSGILALVEKAGGLRSDMIERVFDKTAFPLVESECPNGACGPGKIDAKALVSVAQLNAQGELNRISHALADKSECDQDWYVENFNESTQICGLFTTEFLGGYGPESATYKLIRTDKGNIDESSFESIGEFEDSTAVISEVNSELYDYKFQICENGDCSPEWIELNTDKVIYPRACTSD